MITAGCCLMLEDDHIGSHSQKTPNNRDLLAMTTAFASSLSRNILRAILYYTLWAFVKCKMTFTFVSNAIG